MDPYRSAPPQTRGPELDRLPVFVRGGLIRGGTIVVTPTELLFEPRFGAVRAVPIDAGLAELRMSRLLDDDVHQTRHDASTYETVYTWRQVVACDAYQRGLAVTPHPGVLERGLAFSDGDRSPYEGRTFATILQEDRAVVLDAGYVFEDCFQLPPNLELSDTSSRTLARALRWLPGQVLRQAIDRVRQKHEVYRVFVLTREEMRAARPLAVEGARYRIVGTQADNQVALALTAAEIAVLDAWLSR